jgi:hypothetical protein
VILIWDPRDGKLVTQHTWPSENEGDRTDGIFSLVFVADGRTLIGACCDLRVRVWEVASGGLRYRVEGYRHRLAVPRSGPLLAGLEQDEQVGLWDTLRCVSLPRSAAPQMRRRLGPAWATAMRQRLTP